MHLDLLPTNYLNCDLVYYLLLIIIIIRIIEIIDVVVFTIIAF